MSRFVRVLLRTLAVVTLIFAVVALVAVAVVHTDRFRDWARVQIIAAVQPLFPATLMIGALEGSPFGTLTLRDVTLRYGDADVVHVQRASLRAAFWGLLTVQRARIALDVEGPTVQLAQQSDGTWNLAAAFAPRAAGAAPQAAAVPVSPWPGIELTPTTVREGRVTVHTAVSAAGPVEATRISMDGSVIVAGAGVAVQANMLTAEVAVPDLPPLHVSSLGSYDATQTSATLSFSPLNIDTDRSSVLIEGQVVDLSAPRFSLSTTFSVAAADVRQIAAVPLRSDVTGTLNINGPLSIVAADLEARCGAASVSVGSRLNLAAEVPRYAVKAGAANVDLPHLFDGDFPGGVINLYVDVHGVGTALDVLGGQATAGIRGLAWQGQALGNLEAKVLLDDGSVTSYATLRDGPAPVHIRADAELGEPLRYLVKASVKQLDPSSLPGGRPTLKGALSFDAEIDGSGTTLGDLAGKVTIDLKPSSIGPVELRSGQLRAAIADKRLRIDELQLTAPATRLSLAGDLGTDLSANGRLKVDLRVDDIGPWLRLIGREGAGVVALTGSASGSVAALRLDGDLDARTLAAQGIEVRRGAVRFDLADVQSGTPRGTVTASVDGLEAGLSFAHVAARAHLAAGNPATAEVAVTARDAAQRTQEMAARVAYGGPETTVRLDTLTLQTPAGPWRLVRPATIARSASGVKIDDLRLENAGQTLTVGGRVTPALALDARAERVDLAAVNAFSGRDLTEIAGQLDADLALRGSPERPQARGRVRLRDGAVFMRPLGVRVHGGTVQVDLDEDAIRVAEFSAKAGSGMLSVGGSIGLRDAQPGDIDVSLRLDEWPAIDTQRYKATVAAELRANGAVTAPAVRGRIDVVRASLRPDLAVLSRQSLRRDSTITVVGPSQAATAAPAPSSEEGEVTEPDFVKDLLIDVNLGIGRNSWVRHPDALIELSGDIRAEKPRGGVLVLDGDVKTVRGWVAFRGRRFKIGEGEVRFAGGKPSEPAFDIVASHQFTDYRVEVLIRGAAAPSGWARISPRRRTLPSTRTSPGGVGRRRPSSTR